MLHPYIGMLEEIDELRSSADANEGLDAIADIMIYMMDFCSRAGYSIGAIVSMASFSRQPIQPDIALEAIARMAHPVLKLSQDIRANEDHEARITMGLVGVVGCINRVPASESSLYEVTKEVWTKIVSKRNWVVNPDTAASPAPARCGVADSIAPTFVPPTKENQ